MQSKAVTQTTEIDFQPLDEVIVLRTGRKGVVSRYYVRSQKVLVAVIENGKFLYSGVYRTDELHRPVDR
jgi:hypothetical protein